MSETVSTRTYWRLKGEVEALNAEIAEREKTPDGVRYTARGFVIQKYTLEELIKFRDDRLWSLEQADRKAARDFS
jgi:hypothetical protein